MTSPKGPHDDARESQRDKPLAERLGERFGPDVDPGILLEKANESSPAARTGDLLKRLAEHAP